MVKGIYIHIPFCLNKCKYCDFLSFKSNNEMRKKYINYLINEIKMYPEIEYESVYFGGGTPSILSVSQIKKVLSNLKISKNAEITLEINPKTVTLEKLKELKKIGINRVSIGIQSFKDKNLELLGRMHNSKDSKDVYNWARKAGFENISLDLMFSLPNQTKDDLKDDLKILFKLRPEHFSIYSLIWEDGTVFYEKLKKGELKEIDNEIEADMFELIIQEAKKNGYIHYEISNFSLLGKEAIHNTRYWKNEEYIGVGLGASGYYQNIRYKNYLKFQDYYDIIDNNKLPVLEKEEILETEKEIYKYILGFRLLNIGIEAKGKYIQICKKLVEKGMIKEVENKYYLTHKGIFLANDVFNEFL